MLILDEQTDERVDISEDVVTTSPAITGIVDLIASLPPECRALLVKLLSGDVVLPNSEILVDTVNEKAQEAISDNIIVNMGGVLCIYDEYISEVKSALENITV